MKKSIEHSLLAAMFVAAALPAALFDKLGLKEGDAVRVRQGESYSEQAFNDAVLAEGPIPIALIRAKMLGLPVPE